MPTPLNKQGKPPSSEAGAMGLIAIASKYKEFLLMTAHTIPAEQYTNAHNTFSEPLKAILANQVVVHKEKGLPPLTTDMTYIAFHYLLC